MTNQAFYPGDDDLTPKSDDPTDDPVEKEAADGNEAEADGDEDDLLDSGISDGIEEGEEIE
ncbi:hypothetical protein KJ866_00050 [Patescibacteria group bacterium]|nr:hypothetical protein [Patescibacteria group bacterium]MBU2219590.1 hypothetical protein [Patescibacteria group bacterium]MBU2264657.1 hypothetical protein [Patescibacteria group bacterium]